MKNFYFLTIDKTIRNGPALRPQKEDYGDVIDILFKIYKLKWVNEQRKVFCFEYKEKGSYRRKTKVHDWLHFHGIFMANEKLNCNMINLIGVKGYSLKCIPINNIYQMHNICGYIMKDKTDKVDIENEMLNKQAYDEHNYESE